MCVTIVRVRNFNPFHCTTKRFLLASHFATSAPNDPKITLTNTRSKVLICVNRFPDSQFSIRFAAWPAVFDLQANLRQMHLMTPNDLWILQGQRYLICITRISESKNSNRFRSTTRRFRVAGHFTQNYTEWSLNVIEHKVQCTLCHWLPNFNQFCSKTNRFRIADHFRTSVPSDPKMTLNTTRPKIHHMFYLYPKSKFRGISLYDQRFSSYSPFGHKCT